MSFQEGIFELSRGEQEEHDPFSPADLCFSSGKVPQRLEPIPEPDEPSEKEILIMPDVKVSEIEEKGGICRY